MAAMMSPMKRKMSSTPRKSKKSRYTKLVPIVVEALAETEALPANVRTLLSKSLPVVLNIDKADRHAYETEVVGMAQQALGQVQKALEQKHASSLTAQNAVITPAEEKKRLAAKTAAEAHLEAVKTKHEGDKASKKAAEKVEEDAEDALRAAHKEEKGAEKTLQGYVTKLNHLNNCFANELVAVKAGSPGASVAFGATPAGKKAVHELLSIGKEFGLDGTLLQILPIACKKQVDHRTEFETMVFTSLEALIQRQIATFTQTVADAETVKAAKTADVASASDALEKAKAAVTAASDELAATQAAHKDASKEVSAADSHVRKWWDDQKVVCDAQDELAHALKDLKENVLAAFNELKEKAPEPEEPEPSAEEPAPPALSLDAA